MGESELGGVGRIAVAVVLAWSLGMSTELLAFKAAVMLETAAIVAAVGEETPGTQRSRERGIIRRRLLKLASSRCQVSGPDVWAMTRLTVSAGTTSRAKQGKGVRRKTVAERVRETKTTRRAGRARRKRERRRHGVRRASR